MTENDLPDIQERLLMFSLLYAGLLNDNDIAEKTEIILYSLNNFSGDETEFTEIYSDKIDLLLNELFSRLPVEKIEKWILDLKENSLLKKRAIIIYMLPILKKNLSPDLQDSLRLLSLMIDKDDFSENGDTTGLDEKLNIVEDQILLKFYPERYKLFILMLSEPDQYL